MGGMSYFPHVYQLATLPYQRGNLSRSGVGTPSSLHSSRGEVWSYPISLVKERGSLSTVSLSPTLLVPRDVTSLPFPAATLTEMVLQSPSRKLRSGVRKLMEAERMNSRSAAPKRL